MPCLAEHPGQRSGSELVALHAELLDQSVLRSLAEFYRDHTDAIVDAVTKAQDRHRTALAAAQAELDTVTTQLAQKQLVVDRYFADYEGLQFRSYTAAAAHAR